MVCEYEVVDIWVVDRWKSDPHEPLSNDPCRKNDFYHSVKPVSFFFDRVVSCGSIDPKEIQASILLIEFTYARGSWAEKLTCKRVVKYLANIEEFSKVAFLHHGMTVHDYIQ